MSYLRKAWYAAAWSHEVVDKPLARTLLEEPIFFIRGQEGTVIALADRCPHRFAPLSKGKLIDGAIQCPYHGLRFGPNGSCVHNPHGPIPAAAKVKAYRLIERYGVVWIWMGEPEAADESLLPEFSVLVDPEKYAVVGDYIHLEVNYQLAIDNLLDLSHVQFLHPVVGNSDSSDRNRFRSKIEGNTVWAFNDMPGEPLTKLWKMLWKTDLEVGDRRAYMRWDPPANMLLDVGFTGCGRPKSEGATQYSAHLLTPETERTTHYFWATARDVQRDNVALNEQIRNSVNHAFRNEDAPMMAACQDRMGGTTDLMALQPLLLTTDVAAARARNILDKLIRAEHGEGVSMRAPDS